MAKPLSVVLFALLVASAQAGIWPEHFGPGERKDASKVNVSDQKLWSEYGLEESEKASYGGEEPFTATAYRLQDPTAALAAFYWQRPKNSTPSTLDKLAAETSDGVTLAHGNYLLVFQGLKPLPSDMARFYQQLPKLDQSPLPALIGYLPSQNLVPNSERYVTGPVGLETFFPGIQSGAAAFHLGAEVETATFHPGSSDVKLAIFSYPTPTLARERLAEIEKLPGAMAKRSGPLVAVILGASSPDDAERILSQVKYQASISWSQYVPSRKDNIGDLIVNAFILIGVLLAFSTVAGLAFGGLRAIVRRGKTEDPDALTVLHL